MDTRGIAAVLLKVTGLILIVVVVMQLPNYFPLTRPTYGFSVEEVLVGTAIALGPPAVLGLFLWFFPGTLTNKLVVRVPGDQAPTDFRPIEVVALTIIGVYLVTQGIIGGVRDVVFYVVVKRENGTTDALPVSVIAHAASTVVEIAMGIALSVGSRGVSNMIERLRR